MLTQESNKIKEKLQSDFPVGFLKFHDDIGMNFHFNRFYSYGYLPLEELMESARQIKRNEDVTPMMIHLAEKAEPVFPKRSNVST